MMPPENPPSQTERNPSPTIEEPSGFLDYFCRHRRLAANIALLVGTATLAYGLFLYEPKYASDATVLIKDSVNTSKYVTADTYETKSTSSVLTNPVLNSMALLKTNPISESLWDYFLKNHPEELKRLKIKHYGDWEEFFDDGTTFITAKNVPGTDLIQIKFRWAKPQIAKSALQVILVRFREISLQLNKSEQHERLKFLDAQIIDVEENLEAIRDKISAFKRQQQTVDITNETQNYARTRIDVETALKSTLADAASKNGEQSQFEHMLGLSTQQAVRASALGGNPTLSLLHQKLYDANEHYKQQRVRYTEKHPMVQETRSQIQQIEADIDRETQRMTGSVNKGKHNNLAILDQPRGQALTNLMSAKAQGSSLHLRAGVLRQYLDELNQKLKTLPQIEAELNNLQDQETTLSDALKALQQKALETQIREMQTISNVFVVDNPDFPRHTAFPSRYQFILLGLILGLGAGIGGVLLKQKWELFSARRKGLAPAGQKELIYSIPF